VGRPQSTSSSYLFPHAPQNPTLALPILHNPGSSSLLGASRQSLSRQTHTLPIMPATALATTHDVNNVEAPVTWKAYLICAFASFGGIFFGYDSGYINGVTGSAVFIHIIQGPDAKAISSSKQSLIVSILSAGTFFGAIIAGDCADFIGRRTTIIIGCLIYIIGVVLQIASHGLGLIVAGRLIAGLGVGFESAIVILYMSEIVS
jgi:hypothetical protein